MVSTGAGKTFHRSDTLNDLIQKYRLPSPVFVTRPALPKLEDYMEKLQGVWERSWLTNEGELHKELEQRLCEYLDVEHLSLFCNGTIALLVAFQALNIDSGEVISTPFTFPATVHVLNWNRLTPVFCDIDEKTFNLDPNKIERLITPQTRAILGVHVYGTPCDVEAIQAIADAHGLPVIYDAAHAFGVRYKGDSLLNCGNISCLSFHATKLYTTAEGGALICRSAEQKRRVDFLKNFGIADEETVIGPGINGKMNELQAAMGLLQLDMADQEISNRAALCALYRKGLKDIPGIQFPEPAADTRSNHAYFPILVQKEDYGLDRDELWSTLLLFNIRVRKYFHPLCSHFPCYCSHPSASPTNLRVAEIVARQVLCLPLYGALGEDSVSTICKLLRLIPQSLNRVKQ